MDIYIFPIYKPINNENTTLLLMTRCFINAFFESGVIKMRFSTCKVIFSKIGYHYQWTECYHDEDLVSSLPD